MSDALVCTKCKRSSPAVAFGVDKRSSTGFNRHCKECVGADQRAWYEENVRKRQDVGELTLECKHCGDQFTYVKTTGPRRQFCSERCKANSAAEMRKNRQEHATRRCKCGSAKVARVGTPVCVDCRKEKHDPEKVLRRNRARRLALYGLTQAELDELLILQRGVCAICSTDDPGSRGWHVDHDHACCPGIGSCGNCVRGLLCHCCNLMLGNAKDSVERLEQAKKYLLANAQFSLKLVN